MAIKKTHNRDFRPNRFDIWGYIYWVNVEDADTSAGRTVSAY